eukprot:scaffold195153_cov19-Prasinocladus_malaysianus.AAC.2
MSLWPDCLSVLRWQTLRIELLTHKAVAVDCNLSGRLKRLTPPSYIIQSTCFCIAARHIQIFYSLDAIGQPSAPQTTAVYMLLSHAYLKLIDSIIMKKSLKHRDVCMLAGQAGEAPRAAGEARLASLMIGTHAC